MKTGSWTAVSGSLVLALAGQALILYAGQIGLGGALYLVSVALLVWSLRREVPAPSSPVMTAAVTTICVVGILFLALILRRLESGAIPWGLNNDEGIEGLIACRFMAGEKISPFSSIGVSRETLYHLMLMPLFFLFGPGIPALRLLSLLCGLAAVLLVYWAGKELVSQRCGVFAAFLLAVSPWHLLYSRTGLRNILLPVFVAASLWAFHRALRERRPLFFALTGLFLAAGMNSYTSFRIVPPAFLAWALLRRGWLRKSPLTWKEVGILAGAFAAPMIPQLLAALSAPQAFLARGGYVLSQTPDASLTENLLFSFLMPAIYPAKFGIMQSRWFFGDGVSLVYAAVGRTPETLISAALMMLGWVVIAWRFWRRRSEGEGMLLLLGALTVLTVGLAGPSLTRLIGMLPLLCMAGGSFLEEASRRWRAAFSSVSTGLLLGALLAGTTMLSYDQYFIRAGNSPKAMFYFAAPQTIMGLFAAARAVDHPVTVFYSEEPETLQFLTVARRPLVSLISDPDKFDVGSMRTALGKQELVVENHKRFLPMFTAVAQEFPWAEATVLRDAMHPSETPVAYVLQIDPSRKAPPGAGEAPGAAPPSSPPEPGR